MQIVDFWNKLHLRSRKVIIVLLLTVSGMAQAQSFLWARKNNPFYDEKRKVTYGFLIGLHTTIYQVKYADEFVSPSFNELVSVEPQWKPGFSLGFIVNYRAHEFVDLRMTPKVAFYEHELIYRYTHGKDTIQLTETTMVELPMLVKYKSMRRGNIRAYMIGGLKPGIEASGRGNIENVSRAIDVANFNLSLEAGMGLDLYFPLFKFSPELRFSRGIIDILKNTNDFSKPLKRVNTNTITVYLVFQ